MCQTKAFSFILSLALLTGCASFQSRPLQPMQTALAFESRSLDTPELKEFLEKNLDCEVSPWPPQSWDFRMLTIAALYYHPDMDVARAKWKVAEAEVITAGGRLNPGISLLGQHHSKTAGGISPWTWGASLDIPVETAGKRGYRIDKAKYLSEAAQLGIAATTWRVRGRLRKSLLNLYAATVKEHLLNDHLMIQLETERLIEKRLSVGEVSRFEATQSRLNLDKIRLLLSEMGKQKAEARAAVAESLGLQVNALDGIPISFDLFEKSPEPINLQEIRAQALSNRSDILIALSEYKASQSALQLEISRQYPDIHLGPGYEWDQGDNKWSLGFSVELPVFNRNRGPIEEAEARRKESAARFAALQARVIGEIDRSQAAYSEALKKLQVADALVSKEGKQLLIIQSRFDAGESDRLELEEAQSEFSSSALSHFEAFVSAQENLGMLEDAVQRPLIPLEFPPPASKINPRTGADK
jgi:cobalt-zinc-cadmium efflux system outer membrane protein